MKSHAWNPGTLLQVSGSYWRACTLHAGVKLDIFSILSRAPKTAAQMGDELKADMRGLQMLLDALAAMHLLDKRGESYHVTDAAALFLNRESDRYIGHMIMHHHHLVASWSQLDLAVKTGKPIRSDAGDHDGRRREAFLLGMYNQASQQAPQIVQCVNLAGRRKFLDLGGGPGTYAIHFCHHNPQLEAVVFDLPTTRPFAKRIIDRHGLSERVQFVAGDYTEDALTGRFDVVWLSHILHAEGPDRCRQLIAKAAAVMESGGMMIIHDFILTDTMDEPLFPALFALNMLLGTESGQSYSESQIRQMMETAGLSQIERLDYQGPTESSIMVGVLV
jgi:predicted O-methyltransferase YrrM